MKACKSPGTLQGFPKGDNDICACNTYLLRFRSPQGCICNRMKPLHCSLNCARSSSPGSLFLSWGSHVLLSGKQQLHSEDSKVNIARETVYHQGGTPDTWH